MVELITPQGSICLLANTREAYDINLLKAKSITLVWEMMFTRSMFQTIDMNEQHKLLTKVASLIDQNIIKTILTETYHPINIDNISNAHQVIEQAKMIGKLAITN